MHPNLDRVEAALMFAAPRALLAETASLRQPHEPYDLFDAYNSSRLRPRAVPGDAGLRRPKAL